MSQQSLDVVLHSVLAIHVQGGIDLHKTRTAQTSAPHVNLHHLARLDERLAAHLDGLAAAGDPARWSSSDALDESSSGAVFTVAVRAIEDGNLSSLDHLWARVNDDVSNRDGLVSAFGWVGRRCLQSVVRALLKSEEPVKRTSGIAACAMHRVDPGLDSSRWLQDPSATVRARVLRSVGELGRVDLASRCAAATADEDPDCQFWAAWSAVLLGSRGVALDTLRRTAVEADLPHRGRAFRLTLQALDMPSAHAMLRDVAKGAAQLRRLIQGSGIVGDATYISWLIGHMGKPETARLAGEAFTLITGAGLDVLQLWRAQPNDYESGPNENPQDENVEIDPDEGLMWPDPEKVQYWWAANEGRFQKGTRYFMGAPVTREHCIDVLKNGYQRQRILAAHYLCLLEPGTPLFNTSAPAWRQQKLLAQM